LYYFRLRKVWRYQSVIRSRKFEKDRKHKGETKRDKKTNNDPQNTTQKTKDWATQTPQQGMMNSVSPDEWALPAPPVTSVIYQFT